MPKSVIRTAKKSKDRGQKGGPGAMAKSVFNTTSGDGKIKSAKDIAAENAER